MYDIAMTQKDNNVTAIKTKISFMRCLKIYFSITFFKGSPEQLPLNWACAGKALRVFLKIGLKASHKPERFAQTMSALMGIGMIISLISVPIYYLIIPQLIPQFLQQQELTQSVINITLLLLVWNLAVISYIFKRSLEISTLMAALIT